MFYYISRCHCEENKDFPLVLDVPPCPGST